MPELKETAPCMPDLISTQYTLCNQIAGCGWCKWSRLHSSAGLPLGQTNICYSQLKGTEEDIQAFQFSGLNVFFLHCRPCWMHRDSESQNKSVLYPEWLWVQIINGSETCIKGRDFHYSSCWVPVLPSDLNDPHLLIAYSVSTCRTRWSCSMRTPPNLCLISNLSWFSNMSVYWFLYNWWFEMEQDIYSHATSSWTYHNNANILV